MKDLILSDLGNSLTKQPAEYKSMLKNIDAKMPAVEQGITNFNKSHSQFMGVMLPFRGQNSKSSPKLSALHKRNASDITKEE